MTNTSPAAVDRYDLTYDGIVHDTGGDYVKYDDYAALSSHLEAAKSGEATARGLMRKAFEANQAMQAQLDAALEALALANQRADAARAAALLEAGAELQQVADNCEMRGGSHDEMRGYERSARIVLALRDQPSAGEKL